MCRNVPPLDPDKSLSNQIAKKTISQIKYVQYAWSWKSLTQFYIIWHWNYFRLFSKVQYFIVNWTSLFSRCYLQFVQESNINWRSYTEWLNEHRCNKNNINNNTNDDSIITQQNTVVLWRWKEWSIETTIYCTNLKQYC